MELKRYKLINNLLGLGVFLVAAVVYLMTIEPTTSFWDCGEFIASSYKLEIGHPPGNPVFQLAARFFAIFGSPSTAAMLVNAMSAICGALTVLFLFWTITHIAMRIVTKSKEVLSVENVIAIFGSGIVGALACTFSDTIWFSAVEAEVYAMSSLFTAVVFWAMLKWEECADEPYSNRWIVLIALLMGLSIGVHLLNLLTIPALVFIYCYKKYEVTTQKGILFFAISVLILGVILYGIIPYIPKVASWLDLLFVNVFGLPFNSGVLTFMILLLGSLFFGIWKTYQKKRALWNTILLCFTMILIGYSSFTMIILRSSANTPTNENQPDNPFSLMRYLGREQYGSNPLVYGHTYASPYELYSSKIYVKSEGKYVQVDSRSETKYSSDWNMVFPRMWSIDQSHIKFYETYTNGRGVPIPGTDKKMPTFADNLSFFLDYQLDWMYIRYFLWNFVGRQNDFHSQIPGDLVKGNWESGIPFIDKARLGNQSEGPDVLIHNKAKNHYYFLPLIMGLIGLFYQLRRDRQNWFVVMLLFLMTGIAIVIYLNQPPFQVRERDYAYAGSFYTFTIWIGLSVFALYDMVRRWLNPKAAACLVSALSLIVPIQMGAENWDDHDRSGRYSARDIAYNYLNSCDKNAILVSHGDNDTFPLWYIQEVEGVRTDVRIVNTSLLGTDWYIDQMRYRVYDSDPLPLALPQSIYMGGNNDAIFVLDRANKPFQLKTVVDLVANPASKVRMQDGSQHTIFASRQLLLPVNRENAIKAGIIKAEDSAVLDTVKLVLPESKNVMYKFELAILDMLANYNWDRPIYFVALGGDLQIGIKEYLEYDGFVYKFVPYKTRASYADTGKFDAERMYNRLKSVYKWGNLNNPEVLVDYQNLYTFGVGGNCRHIFAETAKALLSQGESEKAVEVLDKMQEVAIPSQLPLISCIDTNLNEFASLTAIDIYLRSGAKEKAFKLGDMFVNEANKALVYFGQTKGDSYLSKSDTETMLQLMFYLADIYKKAGEVERADKIVKSTEEMIKKLNSAIL